MANTKSQFQEEVLRLIKESTENTGLEWIMLLGFMLEEWSKNTGASLLTDGDWDTIRKNIDNKDYDFTHGLDSHTPSAFATFIDWETIWVALTAKWGRENFLELWKRVDILVGDNILADPGIFGSKPSMDLLRSHLEKFPNFSSKDYLFAMNEWKSIPAL